MDTPSPSGGRQDRKRKKISPTQKETKSGNTRQYRKAKSKMAALGRGQINSSQSELIDQTIDSVASRLDDTPTKGSENETSNESSKESSGDDTPAPAKKPKWLDEVLGEVRASRKEMRALTKSFDRGIKSLEKKLDNEIKALTDSMDYESGRIDGTIEGLEIVQRRSKVTKQQITELTQRTGADSRAINAKINKLERDLMGYKKALERQLASAPTRSRDPENSDNVPDVRAVIIDGIVEVKDEDLLYRVQKPCFRHMGLYLTDVHIEQCFRRGRPRFNAKGEIDNKGRPRTVVCQFVEMACRNMVLQRRFNLRGHRVYVNEHHPFEIEQDRIRQYPIVRKARGMREYKDKIEHIANKIIIDNVAYGVEDFARLPSNLDPPRGT